jgi:hypothetical protein
MNRRDFIKTSVSTKEQANRMAEVFQTPAWQTPVPISTTVTGGFLSRKIISLVCFLIISGTVLYAQDTADWQIQNPILPYSSNYFLTDGEAHNFGGKIYTYQCWDANPRGGYASQFYMQLETADMKHWEVRKILDSRDTVIPEEHRGKILWDCEGAYNKTTGKYLLYGFFDPDFSRFNNPMFVLESDKPSGTFANFRYIIGDKSGERIDGISAQVFTDDDGQRYITYGIPTPSSGNYHKVVIARLADDNVVVESSVTEITSSLRDFFENPSIRKRGDTY